MSDSAFDFQQNSQAGDAEMNTAAPTPAAGLQGFHASADVMPTFQGQAEAAPLFGGGGGGAGPSPHAGMYDDGAGGGAAGNSESVPPSSGGGGGYDENGSGGFAPSNRPPSAPADSGGNELPPELQDQSAGPDGSDALSIGLDVAGYLPGWAGKAVSIGSNILTGKSMLDADPTDPNYKNDQAINAGEFGLGALGLLIPELGPAGLVLAGGVAAGKGMQWAGGEMEKGEQKEENQRILDGSSSGQPPQSPDTDKDPVYDDPFDGFQ